ncbi:RNase H domain-containing protein [Trichonephila clavipes]|nr:RNase H domain-containing protein [Trichonephila clavipes]
MSLRWNYSVLEIYITLTNIANFDGIIVLSDCRSVLVSIKKGKIRLMQEINFFLICNGSLRNSCNLQRIPVHVDIERNEMADSLANEDRTIEHETSSTKIFDADAGAKTKALLKTQKILARIKL